MSKMYLMTGAAVAALIATSAYAADDAPAAAGDNSVQAVIVLGRGEARQVQTVGQTEMIEAVPGVSPLKVLSKLPSVNFQSADPYGNYEWSTRITVRGFNQNQLGFTLDDVPLGDMSYGNDNGLHIGRAITSENVGRSELAQGAGSLETASTSNLGGTLKFYSMDPSRDFGVTAAGTVGSDNMYRTFGRLETGEVQGGGRGYISGVYQDADKWKGNGEQQLFQMNAKFVQPLGDVTLSGFVNYSDRREQDYQDLSLDLIKRLGQNLDNHMGSWDLYKQIAYIGANRGDSGSIKNPSLGTTYPAPYTTLDDTYYDASGLRQDTLAGFHGDWKISPDLSFKGTIYGHKDHGVGTWYTPYVASPTGAPISERTTEYDIERYGAIGSVTYVWENHTVEAGYWFEHNNFHQARRYYSLDLNNPASALDFPSNPFFTQYEGKFQTLTNVYHIQDTWQALDNLKINFGFKAVRVNIKASTVVGSLAQGSITTDEPLLPQVGAVYTLGYGGEVFADYSNNVRAFTGAITSGPFSTTQAGFDLIKNSLAPEKTDTVELGYRYHKGPFEGLVAVYYVDFSNRLLSVQSGPAIVSKPSVLSNVGGVVSQGFEAVGTWRFAPNWSLFGSYAYNDSTYSDNTLDGSGKIIAATKDKVTVDTPKDLLKAEVSYDDGSLFGTLGVSYMGERYYSYINDAKVPDQTLVDLSLGYRVKLPQLKNAVELQLNVTNLTDEKYISTVGSGGIPISDASGAAQTLLPGAPRSVFVTARTKF